MARGRQRQLVRQARDETRLRYGPEIRGLRGLLREAQQDLRLNLKAEEGAAAGIRAATRAAMPDVRRAYAAAGRSAVQADADVGRALEGLSPAADSTRAVAATESGAAKERLAESLARAQADLGRRQVEAETARGYGVRQARQKYASDVSKIRGQKRDLEGEIGTYLSSTYRDLSDADAKLGLERRRIRISLGNLRESRKEHLRQNRDRDAARRLQAENQRRDDRRASAPDGPSRGAISAHQGLVSDIQDAVQLARRVKSKTKGASWDDVYEALTLPKSSAEKTFNPYGGWSPLVAKAAVQLARNGKISKPTMRALKSRGLLVRRAPSGWRKQSVGEAVRGAESPFAGLGGI